jgi:glycosyltransferase involved in cell wall biosynthesis
VRVVQTAREGTDRIPKTLVSLQSVVPSIDGDDAVRAVTWELERDFPWAIDDGWDVEFWGLRRSGTQADAAGPFRVRGPHVPLRRLSTPVRAAMAWAMHFSLTLACSRPGILVAPTPWSGAGAAAARSLRRRRPPLVVRVQGRSSSKALLVRGSRLRFRVIEALERFVLRRADLVVPMGGYTTDRARQVGVPDDRIVVLPFPAGWRDRPRQPPPQDGKQDQLVVCGARLVREKGIDVLVHAFAHVLQRCPEARLCIAGEGPERAELERLAQRRGIASRVEFTGWLSPDEMWRRLSLAGTAVLPSRWEEGLGMFLVEAGLAGCALVATDLGGMRDVVRADETGLLVPPEDAEALADALIRCLTSPQERTRFGRAARAVSASYIDGRAAAMVEFSERVNRLRSRSADRRPGRRLPPARSMRAAAAACAASTRLPILRSACKDVERFIFCATTGRSGTETLAAVLAGGQGVVSRHEPFPIMNSHVLRAAAAGRRKPVHLAWTCLKLPTILSDARGHRVYAETNHQFVKVFADLAYHEFGPRLAVIHLVRDRLAVAASMYELGQIPGTPAASRWLPDPAAPTNIVPFSIATERGLSHPLHRCLWYCLETEARVAAARQRLSGCTWLDLSVEMLNSAQGLRQLDEALDLRVGDGVVESAGQRLNRKSKRVREERRLPHQDAAKLYERFMDAYAPWVAGEPR